MIQAPVWVLGCEYGSTEYLIPSLSRDHLQSTVSDTSVSNDQLHVVWCLATLSPPRSHRLEGSAFGKEDESLPHCSPPLLVGYDSQVHQ